MASITRKNPENTYRIFDRLAKLLISPLLALLTIGMAQMSFAQEAPENADRYTTGLLSLSNGEQALLVNAKVHFEINGPIVSTTYEQSFTNQSTETLVGTYSFPLPENAAISGLEVHLNDRKIKGLIKEKVEAQRIFTEAIKTGKKASLVTQDRPNLFTNRIANIAPGEDITIRINYIQTASYDNGQFQMRFPMTYTPRYSRVPDPASAPSAFVTNANQQEYQQSNQIDITATVNMGFDDTIITSGSHEVTSYIDLNRDNSIQFTLDPIRTAMNKDFVLNWYQPNTSSPRLSRHEAYINGEHFGLLAIYPPTVRQEQTVLPRDITFVIDVSSSMQGRSIEQAKQSLLFALSQLTPEDSFNIITFQSSHRRLFNATVMATQGNVHLATEFVSNITAGGGTEMHAPLIDSLKMGSTPAQLANAIKQVVFLTDGAVGNETQLFKAIETYRRGHRLFMVAIGSAPNQFFIRKAAEFGQGSYINISNINDVNEKMTRFYHGLSQPVLTNLALEVDVQDKVEYYPSKLPDLFLDKPLFIGYKTKGSSKTVSISAEDATQPWQQQIEIADDAEKSDQSLGVSSIWARAKIESLLDEEYLNGRSEYLRTAIIDTSMTHNILSPYTAFIAVEEYPSESPATAAARAKNLLPAGTPIPQTATGWKAQLGLALLLLCIVLGQYMRRNNEA